jgi:hypothetical protein
VARTGERDRKKRNEEKIGRKKENRDPWTGNSDSAVKWGGKVIIVPW